MKRGLLALAIFVSACSRNAPVLRVEIAPTPGVVADGPGLERARKALQKRFEAASPRGAQVRVERGSLFVDLDANGAANWAELRYVIELTGRLDFVPIATNPPFSKELVEAATAQGIVVKVEQGREPSGAENLVFEATGGDPVALASRMRVLLGRVTKGDSRWAAALEVVEAGGVPRVQILDREGAMEHVKITEASPSVDEYGGGARVNAALTSQGAGAFAELTSRLVGRKLAILVDGEIQSAPVVMEAIHGGRVQITLGKVENGPAAAARLAYALGGGELPFPMEILAEKKLGARR